MLITDPIAYLTPEEQVEVLNNGYGSEVCLDYTLRVDSDIAETFWSMSVQKILNKGNDGKPQDTKNVENFSDKADLPYRHY